MTAAAKKRTPRQHFVTATITVRILVDKSNPKEVSDAYTALSKLPDMSDLPKTAEIATDSPEFGSREIEAGS